MKRGIDPVIRKAVVNRNASEALQRMRELLDGASPSSTITGTTVGAVLHLCEIRECGSDASDIVVRLLNLQKAQQGAFSWDEACSSKALKVLCASGDFSTALSVVKAIPQARRRDLEPFFACCKDMSLVTDVRSMAHEKGLSLLDADYTNIVRSIHHNVAKESRAQTLARLDGVLDEMRKIGDVPIVSSDFVVALQENGSESTAPKVAEVNVIDGSKCSGCGAVLQYFPFTTEFQRQLESDVAALPNKVPQTEETMRKLNAFFEEVRSQRIDAVIDGANVGYCGLSSWGAKEPAEQADRDRAEEEVKRFKLDEEEWRKKPAVRTPARLEQVDAVLTELKRLHPDWRVVVVMHERHLGDGHVLEKYLEMVARWKSTNSVLISPACVNDDHCWLYAAVHHWKADRPTYIVSNDKMRDHHYNMLSQRSFVRWRDTCRVTFNIMAPGMKASLKFPAGYSSCLQKDETTQRWHVPVASEGYDVTWYCADMTS
eukprot:PhM_4_TR16593/c0_g1_i1/m.104377/K18213/PRORP; proteinaceous RNase P